jgi:DNA-binding FadR family transcriptional regulator
VNNPLCQVITMPLYAVANERELALAGPADLWIRVDAEHRAIVQAIEAGDPAAASAAAQAHVDYLRTVAGQITAAAEVRPHPG